MIPRFYLRLFHVTIWICRWRMNTLVTSQYQPRLSSITKISSRRIIQSDWNFQIKLNYISLYCFLVLPIVLLFHCFNTFIHLESPKLFVDYASLHSWVYGSDSGNVGCRIANFVKDHSVLKHQLIFPHAQIRFGKKKKI